MRKYLAATFIGATLFLTGCSDTVGGQASQAQSSVSATVESTTPAPTTTQAPVPTTTQAPAPTQSEDVVVFEITQADAIGRLTTNFPAFAGESDATLIELFEVTCGNLDRGGNFEAIAWTATEYGYTLEDGFASVIASVASTCPEYIPDLNEYLNG